MGLLQLYRRQLPCDEIGPVNLRAEDPFLIVFVSDGIKMLQTKEVHIRRGVGGENKGIRRV